MRRCETTLFLREMNEYVAGMPISCIFLKNQNKTNAPELDDYELHIRASLDLFTRNLITQFVKKRELLLMDSNGFIVIYSPENSVLEIDA